MPSTTARAAERVGKRMFVIGSEVRLRPTFRHVCDRRASRVSARIEARRGRLRRADHVQTIHEGAERSTDRALYVHVCAWHAKSKEADPGGLRLAQFRRSPAR